MLWLYQRTMFGKLDNPDNETISDCSKREIGYLLPLVAAAFWIGLYPAPFFRTMEAPVNKLVQQVQGTYYTEAVASVPVAGDRQDDAPTAASTEAGQGH
jgi:NADH-quinone oxidoreductase subunit M